MISQPGGSTFAVRAALLGLGATALLSLTACNAPGLTPTAAIPATTASGPAAQPSLVVPAATRRPIVPTATVSVAPKPRASTPPASTPPTSVKPVTHHYRDARTQWLNGATASSAMQGKYWLAAAADLKAANTAGYAAAITELQQLTALPDAEQTPAQNAEFHHDINALNTFFATPGQYS